MEKLLENHLPTPRSGFPNNRAPKCDKSISNFATSLSNGLLLILVLASMFSKINRAAKQRITNISTVFTNTKFKLNI